MNNFLDVFRDPVLAKKMADTLRGYSGRPVTLMEVCGTHTMAIFRYGIRGILPPAVRLISGPGCPVCVTPGFYVDAAIGLCRRDDVMITTFGDMLRVPGGGTSLMEEKARGRDIRVVYSPLDAVALAKDNPQKKIVFLSVGFETTTPVVALAAMRAVKENINNFFLLCANKTIPNALKVLIQDQDIGVDGFIYPGHVSTIIGTGLYRELAEDYGIAGIVTGFEPLDVLHSIITLVSNVSEGKKVFENQYTRVVTDQGNPTAVETLYTVFQPCDANWRGIGCIPGSGLSLRDDFSMLDAWKAFGDLPVTSEEPKGCMCGHILKGVKTPIDCGLFGKSCTPENPVGSCMVSSEGTCAAYYKYG